MQPDSHIRSSSRAVLAIRVFGALLVLFVGADHLYEYSHDDYSVLPTIGTLFLLNFISATLVGALLLAPVKRVFGRFGDRVLEVAALSGFGVHSGHSRFPEFMFLIARSVSQVPSQVRTTRQPIPRWLTACMILAAFALW